MIFLAYIASEELVNVYPEITSFNYNTNRQYNHRYRIYTHFELKTV
jgi:hypothetical protein